MKKMTDFIINTVLVLCITIVIAVIPTEAESQIYADTLRLHILANSDSAEDQEIKLQIRDRLLEKYGDMLKSSKDKADAEERIESMQEAVKLDVDKWISELGKNYTAEVVIGEEWYDTRVYEDFTLPCGYYTSLRVMLGDASGKNWWCVMYPPLCLDIATSESKNGYTDSENKLICSGKYEVKFKILELMSETFRDFSKKS